MSQRIMPTKLQWWGFPEEVLFADITSSFQVSILETASLHISSYLEHLHNRRLNLEANAVSSDVLRPTFINRHSYERSGSSNLRILWVWKFRNGSNGSRNFAFCFSTGLLDSYNRIGIITEATCLDLSRVSHFPLIALDNYEQFRWHNWQRYVT